MRRKSLILLSAILTSGVLLASCNQVTPKGESVVVYKDNNEAIVDSVTVKVQGVYSSQNYSPALKGYSLRIVFSFYNTSESEQLIEIKNASVICDDDSSSFDLKSLPERKTIGAKESSLIASHAVTPTPLEDSHYSLSATINKIRYIVHLYDKPDNERKDYKVDYKIDDQLVNTITVKENRIIGEDYTYENPNHLSYCNVWKTSDDQTIGSSTKVNSNIVANGREKDNINFALKEDDSGKYVATNLNYIPSDLVVVVPDEYFEVSVSEIGENFFFSQSVKTIYLPKSITTINENNFFCCTLLETINYEGTREEWDAINNLSIDNILDGVTINFETTFVA